VKPNSRDASTAGRRIGSVTCGYPVIAVVVDADMDRAANIRPGDTLFFEETRKQALT
jgi:allophanate hydrolase subunit 2